MRILLFALLLFSSASYAASPGRTFGLSIGGGATHDWMTLNSSGSRSRFDGWGPVVDLGLDIPFSDTFGLLLSGNYHRSELNNTRDDNSSLERAIQSGFDARSGFFWGPVAFGYGAGTDSLRIRQVSVSGGAQESVLNGSTQTYFASYNLKFKSALRLTLEGNYRTADFGGGTNAATYGAIMKLMFLLGDD